MLSQAPFGQGFKLGQLENLSRTPVVIVRGTVYCTWAVPSSVCMKHVQTMYGSCTIHHQPRLFSVAQTCLRVSTVLFGVWDGMAQISRHPWPILPLTYTSVSIYLLR